MQPEIVALALACNKLHVKISFMTADSDAWQEATLDGL